MATAEKVYRIREVKGERHDHTECTGVHCDSVELTLLGCGRGTHCDSSLELTLLSGSLIHTAAPSTVH